MAKGGPGEQRQTQIDAGGIEHVNGLGQVDSERFVAVKFSGDANQYVRKVGVNSPVANFVGVRERVATNASPPAHVVELGLLGAETRFDIAQAVAISELSKDQTKELIPAGEVFDIAVALVAVDANLKLITRKVV